MPAAPLELYDVVENGDDVCRPRLNAKHDAERMQDERFGTRGWVQLAPMRCDRDEERVLDGRTHAGTPMPGPQWWMATRPSNV